MARQCKFIKSDGNICSAYAIEGSDYCFFHTKGSRTKNTQDFSQAVVQRISAAPWKQKEKSKPTGIATRPAKLLDFEELYKEGGIVTSAVDSYVAIAVSKGWQLVDSKTGDSESDNVKLIRELDARLNFYECFEKIFRSLLIYGVVWAEMDIVEDKINRLLFLPPYEMTVERTEDGNPVSYRQARTSALPGGGQIVWEKGGNGNKDIENILHIPYTLLHSEAYGTGLIAKVYEDATDRNTMDSNLTDVTKFIAYPFRLVKVGNDMYPASDLAVDTVSDQLEDLEPGDFMVSKHNIEINFENPDTPEALTQVYSDKTRDLIVTLGVPSLYPAIERMDARTLREIRNIFNSTVESMQRVVSHYFEEIVIKRQFELVDRLPKRTDICPVKIVWNPLSTAPLSILEITQLANSGIIGVSESRRIVESQGYPLLKGEDWEEDTIPAKIAKQAPKEPAPEDKVDEPPDTQDRGKPPYTTNPQKTPPMNPTKPPQNPDLTLDQKLKLIEALGEYDKFEARKILLELLGKDDRIY